MGKAIKVLNAMPKCLLYALMVIEEPLKGFNYRTDMIRCAF